MTLIRALVCSVGLVIALAPTMAALADSSTDHLQAELANAAAQYQLALQQASDIQRDGVLSQENERMIAFLQSEAMRQKQLEVTSNGNAIEFHRSDAFRRFAPEFFVNVRGLPAM